jgi:hypothetical protein
MNLPIPCIIKHHFDDGVYHCAVVKDGRDYVHVIRMMSSGMGIERLPKERRAPKSDRVVVEEFIPLEGRDVSADLQRYLDAGTKFGITLSAERLLKDCLNRADNKPDINLTEETTMASTKKSTKKSVPAEGLVAADLSTYKVSEKVRTESGRKAIDSDDATAKELRGKTLDEVYAIAGKELGQTQKELKEKYQHLNIGMQRMNLGNRIRGARAKAKAEKKG